MKAEDIKENNKKYSIEEAYAEIIRIKNEMGFKEYQSRDQQQAYERGYQQAVIDLNTEFKKRSDMLLVINTTRTEF